MNEKTVDDALVSLGFHSDGFVNEHLILTYSEAISTNGELLQQSIEIENDDQETVTYLVSHSLKEWTAGLIQAAEDMGYEFPTFVGMIINLDEEFVEEILQAYRIEADHDLRGIVLSSKLEVGIIVDDINEAIKMAKLTITITEARPTAELVDGDDERENELRESGVYSEEMMSQVFYSRVRS